MDKEALQSALAAWLLAFDLPAPVPGQKDLQGRTVRLPHFQDEATLRYFFPQRTLLFHQRMTDALRVHLQRRGAKTLGLVLSVEHYTRWQATSGLADTAELRYRYAGDCPI